MKKFFKSVWTFLDGKKTIIGTSGLFLMEKFGSVIPEPYYTITYILIVIFTGVGFGDKERKNKTIINLFKKLKMMTKSELATKLGQILNEKIDIPKVPEWIEGFIFKQAANVAIGIAESKLPENWFDFVIDMGSGLAEEDVEFIKTKFEGFINPIVDIPFIDEDQEAVLMKEAMQILCDYLKIGNAV